MLCRASGEAAKLWIHIQLALVSISAGTSAILIEIFMVFLSPSRQLPN
jgi:hypothetical protein